jgi:8-amino-7-oxononanoate synthase
MMPGNESSREGAYARYLAAREAEALKRGLVGVEPRDARTIRVAGGDYVNFAGNDYLGLRFRPELSARAAEYAQKLGAGSGASRLVTGNLEAFAEIEAKLAALKRKQAALVLASGYQANATVLPAILDKAVLGAEPLVFADRLNHASMHFGCSAAGVRQQRYRHCDLDHLRGLLAKADPGRPKFILTESVFSMDGDVAPISELAELASAHAAMLIVDDAHATGVLGAAGAGLSQGADLVVGTFSKALGGFGAYVACSATMRDFLVNRCGGLIYSTALPPAVLGAMQAALDLLPGLDRERAHVAALAEAFRRRAATLGYDTGASATQIVPLIVGEAAAAVALSARLREAGLWVTAIRPPTVPAGTARLRVAFSAAHDQADLDRLLDVLAEARSVLPAAAE